MTLPERLLWRRIGARDGAPPVFRRQHPVGPYVLDFYRASARLCVEVDGAHHGSEKQTAHDERRDAYLRTLGIRVVRYSASEVLRDPGEVAYHVCVAALAPPQSSDPDGPADSSPASAGGGAAWG